MLKIIRLCLIGGRASCRAALRISMCPNPSGKLLWETVVNVCLGVLVSSFPFLVPTCSFAGKHLNQNAKVFVEGSRSLQGQGYGQQYTKTHYNF